MPFMPTERFRDNDMISVHRWFREFGRSPPDGFEYLGSWVEANISRGVPLMRCDDLRRLEEWTEQPRGLGVGREANVRQ